MASRRAKWLFTIGIWTLAAIAVAWHALGPNARWVPTWEVALIVALMAGGATLRAWLFGE